MTSTSSWPHAGSQTSTIPAQAYTTVNARRTLARPDPTAQNLSKPAAPSKAVEWPPAVKAYVSRAFMADNSIIGIDAPALTQKLKQVITEAAERNMLGTIDWSTYPLPQELIQMDVAAQAGPTTNPSRVSPAKKRKSVDVDMMDADDAASATIPPWRQKNSSTGLADRMTFANKAQADRVDKRQKKIQDFRAGASSSKFTELEKRKQRFEHGLASPSSPIHTSSRDDSPLPDAGPVVGTCQKLEKNYFRLTAPPKPETVRPLPILRQTIELLINKWKDEHNYGYICDQFKSMRQDLTVQHIKNAFTVRVYEAHARIALEKGDLGEYNQCQTQLRALYKQKLVGCAEEFLAYRIFYFIHTCNRTGMNDVLADLTPAVKQHAAVKHALEVRSALATGNYHRFFRLYDDPPNMGGYLMDMFVDRERLAAMAAICKAYKPDVKVQFLTEELAFADDQQCAQFICDMGGEQLLEHREDGPRFLAGKAGQVFEAAKANAFRRVDIKGQI